MPLLFAGLEGEYGLFQNTLNTDYGADDQRRGSVEIGPGQQIYRALGAGLNDVWVHVRCALQADGGAFTGRSFINIYGGSDQLLARVRRTSTTGASVGIVFEVPSAAGGVTMRSSLEIPTPDDTFSNYDISLSQDAGTLTVRFYKDEVLRYTNTIPTALTANALSLEFTNGETDTATLYAQDFIVTDDVPTVGMELVALAPGALGNYNDFTNDYYDINGPGYDPTTTIYTDALAARESWIYADSDFDLGDKIIYAFVMSTVAQLSVAGTIADFQPFVRVDGVDYSGANLGANDEAPDAYTSVWLTNPATSQPWSRDDFRGLEAGVLTV